MRHTVHVTVTDFWKLKRMAVNEMVAPKDILKWYINRYISCVEGAVRENGLFFFHQLHTSERDEKGSARNYPIKTVIIDKETLKRFKIIVVIVGVTITEAISEMLSDIP